MIWAKKINGNLPPQRATEHHFWVFSVLTRDIQTTLEKKTKSCPSMGEGWRRCQERWTRTSQPFIASRGFFSWGSSYLSLAGRWVREVSNLNGGIMLQRRLRVRKEENSPVLTSVWQGRPFAERVGPAEERGLWISRGVKTWLLDFGFPGDYCEIRCFIIQIVYGQKSDLQKCKPLWQRFVVGGMGTE